MSKILITGVAGLLGSHLAEQLLQQGHIVYGVDNLAIGIKENVPAGVRFAKMDLKNAEDIDSVIAESKPDIIHHCACAAYEGLSQFAPMMVTENTYNITLNTLVPAIRYKVKRFVQYSSMAVYGDQLPPFNEKMRLKPVDVYGVGKVAAEEAIKILSEVHWMEYTILRPHNLIGERQIVDPYRNVAMIFMNRVMQGKPPIIYGDGEQKRAFSYVGDAIPAMIRAGEQSNTIAQTINIGPTEEYTINYLAEVVLKELNRSDLVPIHVEERPKEVKNAWCTNAKAKKLLGYATKTTFEEAVHKMAKWAKEIGPKAFPYLEQLELEGQNIPSTWRDKTL